MITTELNAALAGNEPQVRSLLGQLATLIGNLNAHRQDIVRALDGLNALSATLAARNRQIGHVLDHITPGLDVLAEQRTQLVTMLNALHRLSDVAVHTINASEANFAANLRALAPTLRELADAGQNLPLALQVLLTYPFTDQVLKDIKGDYLNAYLSIQAAPGTTVIAPVHAEPRPAHADGRSAGRWALMLTRTTRIQLVVFAVIAVLVMGYTGFHYANLGRLLGLRGYYTVQMELANAGGIFPQADVTYRGVSVGRVGAVRLTSTGVEADLNISNSAPPIPADLQASVADLSAVGEQYVNLRPATSSGPVPHRGQRDPAPRHHAPAAGDQPADQRQRAGHLGARWPQLRIGARTSWPPGSAARAPACRPSSTGRASSSARPAPPCRRPTR